MKHKVKKIFFLVILSLAFNFSHAQSNMEAAVLDIEKSRFDAMVRKNFDKLERLIGDDLYYVHSDGSVDTKESFINGIKAGSRNYDDITIDKVNIRIYGNTAIINGECTYHRKNQDGSPNNTQLRYTNVYVKQNGRWQMVTWQSFKMS